LSHYKSTVATTILNTPLYRLYAENNRFETLNMIKPIKLSQRKIVDIEKKSKLDSEYLTQVKNYAKEMNKKKGMNNQYISDVEEKFNKKCNLYYYNY